MQQMTMYGLEMSVDCMNRHGRCLTQAHTKPYHIYLCTYTCMYVCMYTAICQIMGLLPICDWILES